MEYLLPANYHFLLCQIWQGVMYGSLKQGFWGESPADEKGTLRGDATLSMLSVDIHFILKRSVTVSISNLNFYLTALM